VKLLFHKAIPIALTLLWVLSIVSLISLVTLRDDTERLAIMKRDVEHSVGSEVTKLETETQEIKRGIVVNQILSFGLMPLTLGVWFYIKARRERAMNKG
jgi:hypothetical protein